MKSEDVADDEPIFDWGLTWVEGERVKTLRTALGMETTQFAKAIGTSPTSINNMERAGKQRTKYGPGLVGELAVPVESLAFPPPPALTRHVFFRKTAEFKHIEKPKDQAEAVARLIADVADYFDQRVEVKRPDVPVLQASVRSYASGREGEGRRGRDAARELRDLLQLPRGRITNVVRSAERAGALVVSAPPLRPSIHAYSVTAGKWHLIMLTARSDYYRDRWSVAHETAHMLLHGGDVSDRDVENEADKFAAEFLLPEDELRAELPSGGNERSIEILRGLKETWGVSMAALARRSAEVGPMHDVALRRLLGLIDAKGWSLEEPGRMKDVEMTPTLADALEKYERYGSTRELMLREAGVPENIFEACVTRLPSAPSRSSGIGH